MLPQAMSYGSNINITLTNTFDPNGNVDEGDDTGRLVIAKANFVTMPAKPDEAFPFIVMKDGVPVDLTSGKISIRKTGGSGEFVASDLTNGRFTLTYDTEVTIEGLPLARYTVSERAAGYLTSYEVIDNSVTRPSDGVVLADITVIFTNVEPGGDSPDSPDSPNSPDSPRRERPNIPGPEEVGSSEEYITVEVPLGEMPSEREDSEQERPQSEMPRTGIGMTDALLTLIMVFSIGAAVFFLFRIVASGKKEG